ncbi:MAG: NAD(P)/FAD-dependent oxidoreductase [Actinomycetales bacterium]|nr:NAD(P)/FAD-dependent oxidoreductase [Actinomycetales bacterium]
MDVLVLGGGHNGLVCACYLAAAGHRVTVLERRDEPGGATRSQEVFAGVPVRLSVYSYLVSLLPEHIIEELGLDITLAPRQVASYTPDPDGPGRGLLLAPDAGRAAAAIHDFTGRSSDAEGYLHFQRMCSRLAATIAGSLTEPLPSEAELRGRVGDDRLWQAFTRVPIAETLCELIGDDLVRGVLATDAVIGTFARSDDPTLAQNRCLIAHVIGRGTGQWRVPVGGMGALVDALCRRARTLGVTILTGVAAVAVDADHRGASVTCTVDGRLRRFTGDALAAGVPEHTLLRLLGQTPPELTDRTAGCQVKVNLVLSRLPRLHDPAVTAQAAFSGTFHCQQTLTALDRAHDAAVAGRLPSPLPIEAYCHSLTDETILAEHLRGTGVHTLTLFGLHTPHRLFTGTCDAQAAGRAALASLDTVLAEPLQDCLLIDADGRPCLDVATPVDLEQQLGLPGGNIFHTPLRWPFVPADGTPQDGSSLVRADVGTWGVATDIPRLVVCGSSAARGGAVSGIPGHNAARHLCEILRN